MSNRRQGLHPDRVARRHRDHRRPDRPLAAGRAGRPSRGPAGPVRQQSEAARPRHAELPPGPGDLHLGGQEQPGSDLDLPAHAVPRTDDDVQCPEPDHRRDRFHEQHGGPVEARRVQLPVGPARRGGLDLAEAGDDPEPEQGQLRGELGQFRLSSRTCAADRQLRAREPRRFRLGGLDPGPVPGQQHDDGRSLRSGSSTSSTGPATR